MTREIKFRAKRIDGRGLAYGYFVKTPITAEFNDAEGAFFDAGKSRYCIIQDGVAHEVDVNTLGEYTGLKDKNAKEIYEGDIVKYIANIKWDPAHPEEMEVIGNIYENPEILK